MMIILCDNMFYSQVFTFSNYNIQLCLISLRLNGMLRVKGSSDTERSREETLIAVIKYILLAHCFVYLS